MIQKVDFRPEYESPFDNRILDAFQHEPSVLQEAALIKEQYDARIKRIMAQHDIDTEFEVWSAFVMKHNNEKRDYTFAEELGQVMTAVRDDFRKACSVKAGGNFPELIQPFAAAMYTVTAQQVQAAVNTCKQDMPLMSFPWLFDRELGKIASGHLHTRESIQRVQGIPKRTHRKPAPLEDGDAIETPGGFVHRGDVVKLFGDNHDGIQAPKQEPQIVSDATADGSAPTAMARLTKFWDGNDSEEDEDSEEA